MDLGSLLLSAALLLLIGAFIARPLLEGRGVDEHRPTRAEALAAEREAVLAALRELDFDHAMGKITDEDHAAQRAALVAQGAAILKQLDEIAARPPARTPDDELEAAVRAAREKISAPRDQRVCPRCGHRHHADDRFCAQCGAPLTASTEAA